MTRNIDRILWLIPRKKHTCDLDAIQTLLRKFAKDRDWEQFHNHKDLTMALSIEANEHLERFLWKDPSQVGIDKVKKN